MVAADDKPVLSTAVDWTSRASGIGTRGGLIVRDTTATFSSFTTANALPDTAAVLGGAWSDSAWTSNASGGVSLAPNSRKSATAYEVSDSLAASYEISLDGRHRSGASSQWLGLATNDRAEDSPKGFVFRISFDASGEIGRWQLHRSAPALTSATLLNSGTFSGANAGTQFRLSLAVTDSSSMVARVTRLDTNRELTRLSLNGLSSIIPRGGVAGIYAVDSKPTVTAFVRKNVGTDRPFSVVSSFSTPDKGTPGPNMQAQRGRWKIENGRLVPAAMDPAGSKRAIAVVTRPATTDTDWNTSTDILLDRSANPLGESGLVSNSIRTAAWNYNQIGLFASLPSTTSPSAAWRLVQIIENKETLIQQGTIPVAGTASLTLRMMHKKDSDTVEAVVIGAGGSQATGAGSVDASLFDTGKPGLWTRTGGASFDNYTYDTKAGASAPIPTSTLAWEPKTATIMSPLVDNRPTVDERLVVDKTFARSPVPQALLTTASKQYVAYYDSEGYMSVAVRPLDKTFDEGEKRRLPGNPSDLRTASDTHNLIAIAVDKDGRIHVSGNMHGRSLLYFMTDTSGSLTSFSQVKSLGFPEDESYITYPRFISSAADGPSSPLVFGFRAGGSGDGSWVYFQFDGSSWTRLSRIFGDRTLAGRTVSAYPDGPVKGPDGRYYVAWNWRTSTDVSQSSRVSFAVSNDLQTWRAADGSTLSSPISYDDTKAIVDDVPEGCGLANGLVQLGFDSASAPIVVYSKLDSCGPDGSNQLYVSRWSNGSWLNKQVSDWYGHWQPSGTSSVEFQMSIDTPVVPRGTNYLAVSYRYGKTGRYFILDGASLDVLFETERASRLPMLPLLPDSTYQWNFVDGSSTGDAADWMLVWTSYPGNNDRDNGKPTSPQDLFVVKVTKSALTPPAE
ncbi:BNR repeat-containing protein [Rathayibacter iranicus]|nr:BNR repeat-containing protein [Rathayibacter iranicus]MWV31102.1 hypothetical protein [Rathayibacter iranicus NCPPB 2253 = VKM Ac-1602]